MAAARNGHAAVRLLDGRILVCGGNGNTGQLASSEVYNPATGLWQPVGNMALAGTYHRDVLLNDGRVLVTGVPGASIPLASTEVFNPGAGSVPARRRFGPGRRRALPNTDVRPHSKPLVEVAKAVAIRLRSVTGSHPNSRSL